MLHTIVGVNRGQGVFEGSPYDNVNFHCTTPFEDGKGVGLKVESFKAKYKNLSECFDKPVTLEDMYKLIGSQAIFHFDRYKNVNFVRVRVPAQK
jgi:hypothetical protein